MKNSDILKAVGELSSDRLKDLLTVNTNLDTIADQLILRENSDLRNEFLEHLADKIAFTKVRNKIANNRLKELKGERVPYGKAIEDIIANPAIQKQYDYTSKNLLNIAKPDVKALYYTTRREGQYTVTISMYQLSKAVRTEGGLQNLINGIISTLYSGDNIDEYTLMKNLFVRAYLDQNVKIVVMDNGTSTYDKTKYPHILNTIKTDGTTKDIAYKLLKAIKTYSDNMLDASSDYNLYKEYAKKTITANGGTFDDTEKPLTTFSLPEDLCIALRTDIATDIDIDVLAGLFNIEKAELTQRIFRIPKFEGTEILGCLFDSSFIQVHDTMTYLAEPFKNPDNLTTTYNYFHNQIFEYCVFSNCIYFVNDTDKQLQKTT